VGLSRVLWWKTDENNFYLISSLYVCMAIKYIIVNAWNY
jgi:hypothetical protein